MLLIPNWTILPMWLIFMGVFFILNRFVFQPTLKILDERKKRTVGSEKEYLYFSDETKIKTKEYEALMVEARHLARHARDEILRSGAQHQKEIISEARIVAENELNAVKQKISTEAKVARESLKQKSNELAADIVAQLVKQKVA